MSAYPISVVEMEGRYNGDRNRARLIALKNHTVAVNIGRLAELLFQKAGSDTREILAT
jgi:hypothetical protein